MAKADKGGKGGRGRRRPLWPFVKWFLVAAVWLGLAGLVFGAWLAYDLPGIEKLAQIERRAGVTLLAADGSILATYGDLYGEPVNLRELPAHVPAAVLATEDRRFYTHFGIDPIGILRALYVDLRDWRLAQGGSTITQQLAKNVFLTPERSVRRKGQEFLLALWLEHHFSKDEILTLYLNRMYFGAGTYGIGAAARRFFGKDPRSLSLYEAAMLAGMLKAPARTNPLSDPVLAAGRARVALANMVAAGYLSQADVARAAEDALTAPTVVAAPLGQYFADWVLDQVSDYVGYSERDLVVFTTLDPRLQRLAEQALAERFDEEGEKLGIGQAALAALDPGGAVVAMVGGRDYGQSQFNRATQARRQPGSAFKPFVYLAGFEHGLTPASRLFDGPIAVGNWRPANFDDRYYGDVSLREGFARSLNSVAVQISERVGYARVVEVARRLGIGTEMTVAPSLALGTSEVTLLDLTAAYATFANRGDGVWPHGIIEVRDAAGGILYRRQGSGPGQVVKPRVLAAMLDVMSSAVEWGTGKAARLDRPVAGKTGTSQDYRDAWFVGFTAELVCGVWLGNDDGKPMAKVTGGGAPARLWHAFMVKALAGLPPRLFAVPVGDAVAEAAPQPAGKTPSAFGGGFLDFLEQTLGLGARPNSDQGKLPRKRERDSR